MGMRRRDFVLSALAPASTLMTVRGPVAASSLGVILPHEHLFSMFGEEPAEQHQYDTQLLLATVVPYVENLRALGCTAIFDGTTVWFGRNPALLRDISTRTGVHIVTNTGYYGAANDRYVPKSAFDESADQIAARWIEEWTSGIAGTGIKPGFIKLGVDPGSLSAIDRKLITAAARTHRRSGLTLAVHTGDNAAAVREQLAILRTEGVAPQALVWIHANQCKDDAAVAEVAASGAWISLDGLAADTLDRHLALCRVLKAAGRLSQVLLSHDGNTFRANGKRPMKAYTSLFTDFLPQLRAAGFENGEVRSLTVDNPARAYAVGVRRLPQ